MRRMLLVLPELLAGCTVGPDYRPRSVAELGVPDGYPTLAAATPKDLTRWWDRFDDPVIGWCSGTSLRDAATLNLIDALRHE